MLNQAVKVADVKSDMMGCLRAELQFSLGVRPTVVVHLPTLLPMSGLFSNTYGLTYEWPNGMASVVHRAEKTYNLL